MNEYFDMQQRPSIRHGYRLQWEAAQSCHVLLYPEGMVKLNGSAGEIVSRCTGAFSIQEIVADLERTFDRAALADDVVQFLAHAWKQGWIDVQP